MQFGQLPDRVALVEDGLRGGIYPGECVTVVEFCPQELGTLATGEEGGLGDERDWHKFSFTHAN